MIKFQIHYLWTKVKLCYLAFVGISIAFLVLSCGKPEGGGGISADPRLKLLFLQSNATVLAVDQSSCADSTKKVTKGSVKFYSPTITWDGDDQLKIDSITITDRATKITNIIDGDALVDFGISAPLSPLTPSVTLDCLELGGFNTEQAFITNLTFEIVAVEGTGANSKNVKGFATATASYP